MADIPVLLARSAGATPGVESPLVEAGFKRLTTSEHLFWMRGTPSRLDHTPFEVRQMKSARDLVAMQEMFVEVHDYDRALTDELYGSLDPDDHDLTCWIAWDGVEAVSLAFVTYVDTSLALWEVMTPPRHRRRGAARAVVSTGLDEVAKLVGGVDRTLFWSSPAGRPLYDALGFEIGDTVEAWVRGASAADLAAVGAG